MSEKPRATQPRQGLSLVSVIGNLGWPILLGLAATSVFFILVYRGPLNLPVMHRYFASHPVTFAETALFFIGLASLGLKLIEVTGQYLILGKVELDPPPPGGQSAEDAPGLMSKLDELGVAVRGSHLVRRLRDALEFVRRTGSADQLHEELKYLADVEAARQQDAYSLVRIVIWATPMLGFLGTVMGITQALGDLSANAKLLATSIDTAIQGLLSGLYVAFDTTALALTLSMVLMFLQFLIDRAEVELFGAVDARAGAELVGRFQVASYSSDPQVATVERMAHAVVRSTEQLVQRQALVWRESLAEAQQGWQHILAATGDQVRVAVDGALEQSVEQHAARLAHAEQAVLDQARTGWERMQAALYDQTERLTGQQAELARQGDILLGVLKATGEVVQLEQALNANLAALAGSKNFEETVMSLAAAIHLLTARLGRVGDGPTVELSRHGSPVAGTIRPSAGAIDGPGTLDDAVNSDWNRAGTPLGGRDAGRPGKAA